MFTNAMFTKCLLNPIMFIKNKENIMYIGKLKVFSDFNNL